MVRRVWQVLWEGSFNLVSNEGVKGYMGRAWWDAVVVKQEGREFKIHYPQWDSSLWDEWVSRDRMRWPPPAPDTDVRSTCCNVLSSHPPNCVL